MQTLHVQQRCVPPPFDIDRCIGVGMKHSAATPTIADPNEEALS